MKTSKKFFQNFLFVILVFFLISAVFALFSPSTSQEEKNIPLSQLAQDIKDEKIEKVEVFGEKISIFYKSGEELFSRKEIGVSIFEPLINYGLTSKDIQKAKINIEEEKGKTSDWLLPVLGLLLPILIFVWFFWIIFKQAKQGAGQTFNFLKSPAKNVNIGKISGEKVFFKDIADLEEAKEEISEVVNFLKTPKKFWKMGARIPRGVLLIGPPGTGKCITGQSLIYTNKGLIEIKDVPKYFNVNEKTNRVFGAQLPTVELNNEPKNKTNLASHWHNLGEQKTIRIVLKQGTELEGTPEHPIVVLNNQGNLLFKTLGQLRKNDMVAIKFGTQSFGHLQEVKTEQAYIMGLLTGDGNLSHSNRIGLTTTDPEIVNSFHSYIHNNYGEQQHIYVAGDGITQTVTSWKIKKDFYNAGMSYLLSFDKTIPDTILQSPKETIVAFLQGLFDADGYFERYNFGFSTVSKKLSDQTMALLLNFNIIPHRRIKHNINHIHPRPVYEITISGTSLEVFAKEIGFRLTRKQNSVKQYLDNHKTGNTNVDIFPYIADKIEICWKDLSHRGLSTNHYAKLIDKVRKSGRVSRKSLSDFLNFFKKNHLTNSNVDYLRGLYNSNLFFSPVIQSECGKANVYDFTVPKSHSFISNGIVSHNTMLARAVASESKVPFFSIAGSAFIELFVGVGSARVRNLFETAKKHQPSIVFIDELDAIGKTRMPGIGGGHEEREQTLNQILSEMDGFEKQTGVIVLGATNRPEQLDPALLRPGRFDRRIVLDFPDVKGREAILKIHCREKPLAPDVKLSEISERTPGFSGADLANLVNEAAILAAKRNEEQIYQKEFLESIEKVLLGPERRSHLLSSKEKKIAAFHEAGHALVTYSIPEAETVRKISIVSRGMAAGYTLALPKKEKRIKTKSEFLAELSVLLGGYCAERLKFKEMSTGASNDLEKSSTLARNMVTKYGMSKLGPISFGKRESMSFLGWEEEIKRNYSEKTAIKIDSEVSKFIRMAEGKTMNILRKKKEIFERIAQKLIEKETLEKEEFEELAKGGTKKKIQKKKTEKKKMEKKKMEKGKVKKERV